MVNFGALAAEIDWGVWAPQQISTGFASWLRYCSDVAHRRSTNFARSLAVYWAGTLYMSEGSCPLTEFCQLQNSLCIQVLRSPILAVWLHGTGTAVVSQTLWRGTRNGIAELSQRAPPIFGWAAITLGIGLHSSLLYFTFTKTYFGACRLGLHNSAPSHRPVRWTSW